MGIITPGPTDLDMTLVAAPPEVASKEEVAPKKEEAKKKLFGADSGPLGFFGSFLQAASEMKSEYAAIKASGLPAEAQSELARQMMMEKLEQMGMGDVIKPILNLIGGMNGKSLFGESNGFMQKLESFEGLVKDALQGTDGLNAKDAADKFKANIQAKVESGEIQVADKEKFMETMKDTIDKAYENGQISPEEMRLITAQVASNATNAAPQVLHGAVMEPKAISFDLNDPAALAKLGLADGGKMTNLALSPNGDFTGRQTIGLDVMKRLEIDGKAAVGVDVFKNEQGQVVAYGFHNIENPEQNIFVSPGSLPQETRTAIESAAEQVPAPASDANQQASISPGEYDQALATHYFVEAQKGNAPKMSANFGSAVANPALETDNDLGMENATGMQGPVVKQAGMAFTV
jgi:hypothetical protein